MPTRRQVKMSELTSTVNELLIKHNKDPINELIAIANDLRKGHIPVAPGQELKAMELVVKIWTHISGFRYPRLQSSETHGTQETIYNITIKHFGTGANALKRAQVVELRDSQSDCDDETDQELDSAPPVSSEELSGEGMGILPT